MREPDSPFALRCKQVLPPSEWRVLVAVANGLSDPEIATALGRSLATIKCQLSRARRKVSLDCRVCLEGKDSGRRLVALLTGFLEVV